MPISLTGSGGYFTRLGHLIAGIKEVQSLLGTTLPARASTVFLDFQNAPDQYLNSGVYAALQGYQSDESWTSQLQAIAQAMTIQMAQDDAPQVANDLPTALAYLIGQMTAAAQSVKRCTVGVTVTAAGTNVGNGALAVGLTSDQGNPLENVFAETVTVTTTADAQSGGATAGQESLTAVGTVVVDDPLSYLWPAGSGAAAGLTAVAGNDNAMAGGTANWLYNGSCELYTADANVPDGFTRDVGASGTQIVKSGTAYDGSFALSFVGDGSTLTSVYQQFGGNGVTGPTGTLTDLPASTFAVNLWAKTSGTPAAGVLEVALTDGTGTILLDEAGNPSKFTVALTTLGTTFKAVNGFLRTPAVLPATVRLRLRLSTALSAGTTLFLDRLAFAQPTAPYPQGPRLCWFSGSAATYLGDSWTATVTNDGGVTGRGFQRWGDALFDMKGLGLLFPTSASPTISDSALIV